MATLKDERERLGLTRKEVAEAVKCDPINLFRIEGGKQSPRRPLARALWHYFDGAVPIGVIYDGEFVARHES